MGRYRMYWASVVDIPPTTNSGLELVRLPHKPHVLQCLPDVKPLGFLIQGGGTARQSLAKLL